MRVDPSQIRKFDLATEAGCAPATVTLAMASELRPALTPNGKRLYRNAPTVRAFVARQHRLQLRARTDPTMPLGTPETPSTRVDPFTTARQLATVGRLGISSTGAAGVLAHGPSSSTVAIDQALAALRAEAGGALPPNLGALTMREVFERFGSLKALADAVKAGRDFADMQVKEQLASQRRGDVVDRTLVAAVFAPLVDLAFRRIVNEAPQAMGEQIIARVLTGGDDLAMDVENLLRRELGGILEDCRDTMAAELVKLAEVDNPRAFGMQRK